MFTTWSVLMHGIKGMNFYMIVERERWYGSPVRRDGSIRERHYEFFRKLLSSLDAIGMEEGDLRGGALCAAADMLASRFGGKVRAIVAERSELERIVQGRFPILDLLWALNTGDIRMLNVPRRWKALISAASLAATLK